MEIYRDNNSKPMKYSIFMQTVGEDVIWQTLATLFANTPELKTHEATLTIWYDACRSYSDEFYKKLLAYTDDVILVKKDHGITWGVAFGLLYLTGTYRVLVLADTAVRPGWIKRLEDPFKKYDHVAATGSILNEEKFSDQEYLSNIDVLPDGVQMFSGAAIDDIGGILPAFRGYGHDTLDWHVRAVESWWNVVAVKGIMDELGTKHDGRVLNPRMDEEIAFNSKVLKKVHEEGKQKMHWWVGSV